MQPFVIPLNGLTQGGSHFEWTADGKFFGKFDNTEILAAELVVGADVHKSSGYTGVACGIAGKVMVQCDRCLDDLWLDVDTVFRLSVKFGNTPGRADAGEVEIVMVPEGEAELDLSQFVYDYVCTSIPMHRVHPDGDCNPEAVKYLSGDEIADDAPVAESPFAALKDILK